MGLCSWDRGPSATSPVDKTTAKPTTSQIPQTQLDCAGENQRGELARKKEPSHVYGDDKISIFVSLEKNVVDIKLAGSLSAKMFTISVFRGS